MKHSDKIAKAHEALQATLEFFAWETAGVLNSAKARIIASLGKEKVTSLSSALTGTAQSLAKLSREKAKGDSEITQLEFLVSVFTAISLLAQVHEKPEAEATPEKAPEAPAKPRATRKAKDAPAQAPEVPAILAGLTPALTQTVSQALTPQELALLQAYRATL